MIRSSSVLRKAAAAAAIAVLALTVGLSAAVPAQADDGDPDTSCGTVCELLPGDQQTSPDTPGTGKPTSPPAVTPRPTAVVATPAPTSSRRSGGTGPRAGFHHRPGPHGFCSSKKADAGGHDQLRVTFGDFRESVH